MSGAVLAAACGTGELEPQPVNAKATVTITNAWRPLNIMRPRYSGEPRLRHARRLSGRHPEMLVRPPPELQVATGPVEPVAIHRMSRFDVVLAPADDRFRACERDPQAGNERIALPARIRARSDRQVRVRSPAVRRSDTTQIESRFALGDLELDCLVDGCPIDGIPSPDERLDAVSIEAHRSDTHQPETRVGGVAVDGQRDCRGAQRRRLRFKKDST